MVAISFSRPDPASPASVRDANFPTARRGFDQQQVRDFLRLVATELARMQERERFLDQELRSMRLQRPGPPVELDDETLARLLGEETTRILQAARESAAAIRAKAEEAVERMVREAREDAQHLRDEADSESHRRRRDAEQDAEAELAMAKQQGREMVEEARAYRERVLSELSRRRDLARQQIDQLVHGRDRLVQAFERARLVAADVVAELVPLGELSEYVNLSPTTGPVPVMVPASRLAGVSSISDEALAMRASSDPDDPALDPNGSSDATAAIDARLAPTTIEPRPDDVTGDDATPVGEEPPVAEVDDGESLPAPPPSITGATVLQFPDRRADAVVVSPGAEAEDDEEEEATEVPDDAVASATEFADGSNGAEVVDIAEVDTADVGEAADVGDGAEEVDDDEITANDVDDLFARLRSESVPAAAPGGDVDESAGETTEPDPFELRDEALTPLIVSSGRKLKRVLADEQNDVLERLRGKTAVRSADDLLPDAEEHAARYFGAISTELGAAVTAGADSVTATSASVHQDVDEQLGPVRAVLVDELVAPLRGRIGDRVEAVDGDNEELRQADAGDLPRMEDEAHRRPRRRPVPSRLQPRRVWRPGGGGERALVVRSHGRTMLGLRGQRPPGRRHRRQPVPDRAHLSTGAHGLSLPRRARRLTGAAAPPTPWSGRAAVASLAVRRAADLPRRRSWLRASGRVAIIGIALFIIVVVIFGRAVARFYIEALWFDGLGQSGVFWGAIRARLTLFALFFVAFALIAGGNVAIADKLAPTRYPANPHPIVDRVHELFGRRLQVYRYAIVAVFAVLMALPASTQWQAWMLYRNSQSFGSTDAEFHVDVGFYVFELPFINFVLDWLFFAIIVVLLLTLLAHVLNGGAMFASPMPTLSAGARGHLAVLLAVLAALKAADYWVHRYETTNERRGFVQGATYSIVHAQLPALLLLSIVALVTAALYLSTLRSESWRLPLISSAIWLVLAVVAGYIYPAAVQGLVVNPNQKAREAPYIERNVFATREAMGLDVATQTVSFRAISAESIAASSLQPLVDVRLLNPSEFQSRFQIDGGGEAGLTIADVDVDRYDLAGDGDPQQVLIAARELDLAGIANLTWQGRHLINTRGCGVLMAPAGQRARERPPGLRAGRLATRGALLQPEPHRLRRRRHRGKRAHVRQRRRGRAVFRHRRCCHVVVRASPGVRAGVHGVQRRRIGGDRRRFADVVGAQRPGPRREAGAVPLLRRRPLSSGRRRDGAVGGRRLHVHEPLPICRGGRRRRRPQLQQRHPPRRQLRPQQRQGRRRRL